MTDFNIEINPRGGSESEISKVTIHRLPSGRYVAYASLKESGKEVPLGMESDDAAELVQKIILNYSKIMHDRYAENEICPKCRHTGLWVGKRTVHTAVYCPHCGYEYGVSDV